MDIDVLTNLVFWMVSILYAVNSFGFDQFLFKASPFTSLGKFLASTKTIFDDYSSGRYYKPWSTNTPIIVRDKRQILELSESSTVLSQRAVYADMFGFKHTLGNFDHNELNSQKSRLFSRLIHIKGSQNLPHLFPHVEKRVIESLDELLAGAKPAARTYESSPAVLGLTSEYIAFPQGTQYTRFCTQTFTILLQNLGLTKCYTGGGVTLPIAETVRTMASRAMCVMFFGETLSRDTVFANALLRHPKEMISCMAAFQITPTFMSPYVHKFLTKGGRSQNLILEKLADIMGAGRDAWDEKPEMKKLTLAWNMAELTADSKYWQGPEHLAQSLLGIWFAAAHQPWMFLDFIILILAVRPDLQEAIRQEVRDSGPLDYSVIHRLPLLDSLIKEVVRLHPLDTMAVRRKAMRDFTFTTGNRQFCPVGSTVCVSAYDQMHDEKFYPHPDDFLPSRFVNTEDPLRGAQFVEVSEKYPIWGYGSLACPGRVHASTVIKIVILQILQRFDISLENEQERRMWSWETFTMPYESTRFVLKEKFC
ncbi:hypothetical protein DPSP01_000814 [Paraphaeosphaeria sporulosa]